MRNPLDYINAHPYAMTFPKMGEVEFAELKRDIKLNGVRQPIVMYRGLILDGRHRYAACSDLDIDCPQEEFAGDDADALTFVISTNLHRRHLKESQRAWVADKLATMRKGRHTQGNASIEAFSMSQPDAAKMLNVARSSVQRAAIVRDKGVKELHDKVEGGDLAVSVASKIAKLPKDKQREVLKDARPEQAIKKVARAGKERALAERTIAESFKTETARYGVIYADPPWRFETRSENGMDRSADNHYPMMTLDDIAALPAPAARDAVLFPWATAPMLPEALDVMRVWGFAYKSQIVWVKDRVGTGYWARNQHEIMLIGTRGDIPAPVPGTQPASVITAPVRAHSAKPAVFAEMIEGLFPNLPKVEMFCRSPRAGWAAHGNEAHGTEATNA